MSKISVQPPSGFRDFTPAESALRAYLIELIAEKYRLHGFQQIFTPACENLPTLQGKGGGTDNEKLIFKLMKRGEALEKAFGEANAGALDLLADLGLRFDLTLPLARYISNLRNEIPLPFKVFQVGPVWRADRPQKGRFREFYQCDVDIVGAADIGSEIECLSAILAVFKALKLDDVIVHINSRVFLSEVGTKLGIAPELWKECLISLDKLDKLGQEGVLAEMQAKISEKEKIQQIADYFFGAEPDLSNPSLSALAEIQAGLEAIGIAVKISPSLVRGQDYYTGTIFEIRHPNIPGSLAGGGRYDRLLEIFGGQATPAFGGSIGFERLAMLLEERQAGDKNVARLRPQVFFPLMDAKLRPDILKLAAALRARAISVDVYPDAGKKLANQFKYADARGIPFTAMLGESELAAGKIIVKDMAAKTQSEISLNSFPLEMEKLCRPN